jgi:hypothetical protein
VSVILSSLAQLQLYFLYEKNKQFDFDRAKEPISLICQLKPTPMHSTVVIGEYTVTAKQGF